MTFFLKKTGPLVASGFYLTPNVSQSIGSFIGVVGENVWPTFAVNASSGFHL
jgi:hypothetical protein